MSVDSIGESLSPTEDNITDSGDADDNSNPELFGEQSVWPPSNSYPMLSIVVPAYNEAERIGVTLKRMLAYFDSQCYPYEILVVSDGSNDGTMDVVTPIAARRSQVRLLSYAGNRGKGYAVRYGILRAQGERILFSDADLATPIEEIEKLSDRLDDGYDIAIGSRDVAGSQLIKRQSLLREFGGKTFNKIVQALAVPGIHDTQCGFKLFTRAAALSIFRVARVDHFAFDVEALYLAMRVFGYRIAEVPVRWQHVEGSKVRFARDAYRMAKTVFRIRFTHYDLPASAAKLHLP